MGTVNGLGQQLSPPQLRVRTPSLSTLGEQRYRSGSVGRPLKGERSNLILVTDVICKDTM
jgi:hypothetical protein